MAERIVDVLEPVEVEAEHGERGVARQYLERFLDAGAEDHPVRQVGERVVPRHVADLRLGPAALRYVLMRRQPAAVHRLEDGADGPAVLKFPDRSLGEACLERGIELLHMSLWIVAVVRACNDACVDDVGVRRAGREHPLGQPVEFAVAVVADDQPVVVIEHAKADRHVGNRGLQALPVGLGNCCQFLCPDEAVAEPGGSPHQGADLVVALVAFGQRDIVLSGGEPAHGLAHLEQRRGDRGFDPDDRGKRPGRAECHEEPDETESTPIDVLGLLLGRRRSRLDQRLDILQRRRERIEQRHGFGLVLLECTADLAGVEPFDDACVRRIERVAGAAEGIEQRTLTVACDARGVPGLTAVELGSCLVHRLTERRELAEVHGLHPARGEEVLGRERALHGADDPELRQPLGAYLLGDRTDLVQLKETDSAAGDEQQQGRAEGDGKLGSDAGGSCRHS